MNSTESPLRPQTLIIADDLTGACDAAVAFSCKGISTQVLLGVEPGDRESLAVNAICTESRDVPVERAVKAIHRVAQRHDIKDYDQVFKKIDSIFRGNTFDEIYATLHAFSDYFAVIAPAYPALGRTSSGGMLNISDIAGEASIRIQDGLRATGLSFHWIAAGQSAAQIEQQMSVSLRNGNRAVFCDAVTDKDLQATVCAAKEIQMPILWVGSAGLAHALAGNLAAKTSKTEHRTGGKIVLFVGSNHPVTQKQVFTLLERHAEPISPREINDGSSTGNTILLRVERNQTAEEDIRAAVSDHAPQTISCLFMTGGDTAILVCRALGIRSFRMHEEFEPGVPQCTAVGGSFDGCTVILKSGGFGHADILNRIVKHFSEKKADVL